MAIVDTIRRKVDPILPKPPPVTGGGNLKFPNDLTAGGRNFYTTISFQGYGMFGGLGAAGIGGITLPIPRKINDHQTVVWEETSIVSASLAAVSQGLTTAGAIAGAGIGYRLNPALIMMFKQPNFKEWNLQWTLAPNSQGETDTITQIVKNLKRQMSPGISGPFYTYPSLAVVSFSPNSHLPKLKPAAIMSVQVDFTGAGQPAFFNNGGPAVVSLQMSLREVQLWTQNDSF